MTINFSVHVEYSNGKDASNKKVFLDIHGGFAGTWLEDFTDSNGDVDFELERNNSAEITFIVDGDTYQTETVYDGDKKYITLGDNGGDDSDDE
jgi:uncharacterized GH25 family protein